jgi:hypothetical protein
MFELFCEVFAGLGHVYRFVIALTLYIGRAAGGLRVSSPLLAKAARLRL